VFVRPDRIGDVVVSTPLLRAWRERFPQARLGFATPSAVRPLLHFQQWEWMATDDESSFQQELENLKPDIIIHLNPNPSTLRAGWQAQVPVRWGWSDKSFAQEWLTHQVEDVRAEGYLHEAQALFHLVSDLGFSVPTLESLQPQLAVDAQAQSSLVAKLQPDLDLAQAVVLHPCSANAHRRWSVRYWEILTRWIVEELQRPVCIVGSPKDDPALVQLRRIKIPQVHHLGGQLNLAELALVLERTAFLVSVDSGPAHIASAMHTPQLTLFGRTEPAYGPTRWRPLNPHGLVLSTKIQRRFWETNPMFWRRGFRSITPEIVQYHIRKALC
jgi:ADP-heptose:LPS heptosyltransferase